MSEIESVTNVLYSVSLFVAIPYALPQLLPSKKWLITIAPLLFVLFLDAYFTFDAVIERDDRVSFPFAGFAFIVSASALWGILVRAIALDYKSKSRRVVYIITIAGFFVLLSLFTILGRF